MKDTSSSSSKAVHTCDYLACGGHPPAVTGAAWPSPYIELLRSSAACRISWHLLPRLLPGAGYAQMCNVMCEWLEIADVRTSSSKHGSSGGARAAAAAGSSSAAAAAGGAAAGNADGGVPDEFMLLSVRHTSED
jgi:hypothetical protein